MKNVLLICVVAILTLSLTGCSDPGPSRRVLEANGYKDIQITGYEFFGCGQDDAFHTGFTAMSPSGTTVTGVVCSSFLKGSTIRFK